MEANPPTQANMPSSKEDENKSWALFSLQSTSHKLATVNDEKAGPTSLQFIMQKTRNAMKSFAITVIMNTVAPFHENALNENKKNSTY